VGASFSMRTDRQTCRS